MPRVKDLSQDLNDDDYEDYEEYDEGEGQEEVYSEEDKRRMSEGVKAVREILGSEAQISTSDIEEALWHYYYDVEKSVAYLIKKIESAQNKKAPAPSKAASTAASQQGSNKGNYCLDTGSVARYMIHGFPCPHETVASRHEVHFGTGDLFRDIPWLQVPPERLANIQEIRPGPRLGLLGGSGKPSKLAALAAARRKAQDEKLAKARSGDPNDATSTATSKMSNLQVDDPHEKATSSRQAFVKRRSETAAEPSRVEKQARQEVVAEDTKEDSVQAETQIISRPEETAFTAAPNPRLEAVPSAFASTLLGSADAATGNEKQQKHHFTYRYPSLPGVANKSPFAGPSPDDVAQKAQSSTKGNSKPSGKNSSKAKDSDKVSELEGEVAALKVSEKVKSKNLDVPAEYEKSDRQDSASFVVIGHVDHGKSTLMGRLLRDLQTINERAADKLQKSAAEAGKSSFGYAWILDSTEEERARGVTIDIATNSFTTPAKGQRYTILDAPGHKDFIPNMIAGVAQADFALLVIDASPNAFESGLRGQTKEHALLARSMGVSRLIIAVNKMDSAEWSQGRFDEIRQQVAAFLMTSDFQEANLTFVPCAGLTGENVAVAASSEPATWYKGPTLVDALDSSSPTKRRILEPLRLTIMDVFRGSVTNPISIAGRLDAGTLQIGDPILVQPSGETATIKGIELDNGSSQDWAVAGDIATLHLVEIDKVHLRAGDVVSSPLNEPISNIKTLTMKILAFEHLMPGFVEIHKGRMHVVGRVKDLVAVLHRSTGEVEKKKPRVVQPGALARVRLELDKEIPLEAGVRIVLRNEGSTIGAGIVEEVQRAA